MTEISVKHDVDRYQNTNGIQIKPVVIRTETLFARNSRVCKKYNWPVYPKEKEKEEKRKQKKKIPNRFDAYSDTPPCPCLASSHRRRPRALCSVSIHGNSESWL